MLTYLLVFLLKKYAANNPILSIGQIIKQTDVHNDTSSG